MDRKEREEIRKKVETKKFLRETFDYDERGFLVWKEDRSNRIKAGMKAGYFSVRHQRESIGIDGVFFLSRRLIWIFHKGVVPEDFVVTTKNRDSRDIRIRNLELHQKKIGVPQDRSLERDPEILRTLFDYDPVTGVLTWKTKTSSKSRIVIGDVVLSPDVGVCGVLYKTHRICFVVHHGRPIVEEAFIDHINGIHRDNRIENLREVTPSQNAMNSRSRVSKKSGLPKGVTFHLHRGRFIARIRLNRREKFLGYFDTPEEASAAYQAAAKAYFGEYACLDR